MSTRQPTGPSGVLLKSNGPWKYSHAEILEEIEGKFRLGKEEAPKVWGKGWIHTGQDGNEVGTF
jgi:hypothetical protein